MRLKAGIVTSLLSGMFQTFGFGLGLKLLLGEVNNAVVQTCHRKRRLTVSGSTCRRRTTLPGSRSK
jgi:hypothetical protein